MVSVIAKTWNQRLTDYMRGKDMFPSDIARQVGKAEKTIYRWLKAAEVPNSRDARRFEKEYLIPFESAHASPGRAVAIDVQPQKELPRTDPMMERILTELESIRKEIAELRALAPKKGRKTAS